jgi:hypothetical protein
MAKPLSQPGYGKHRRRLPDVEWLTTAHYAMPWAAVQARPELGRAYLALADAGGARTMLREIEALLNAHGCAGGGHDSPRALRNLTLVRRRRDPPSHCSLERSEAPERRAVVVTLRCIGMQQSNACRTNGGQSCGGTRGGTSHSST